MGLGRVRERTYYKPQLIGRRSGGDHTTESGPKARRQRRREKQPDSRMSLQEMNEYYHKQTKDTHALQTVLPSSSFLHRGVAVVLQL